MARPNLFTHRKFIRLARLLGAPYKATGVLEMVWNEAYSDGNPNVGAPEDVEFMLGWDGDSGACSSALVESGFLDLAENGDLVVHDLKDHEPSYVRKRRSREADRKSKPSQRPVSDQSVTGQCDENGRTPTHAHAPTPTPTHKDTDTSPGAPDDLPPAEETTQKLKTKRQPDVSWWFEEWNRIALTHDLAQVQTITESRKRAARARLKEHGESKMQSVLEMVEGSKFLKGIGGRDSWRGATADWLLKPTNFAKTLDGNYGDIEGAKNGKPVETVGTGFNEDDIRIFSGHPDWNAYIDAALEFPPGKAPRFEEWAAK